MADDDDEGFVDYRKLLEEKIRLERMIKKRVLTISQLRSDIKYLIEVLEENKAHQQFKDQINSSGICNSLFDPEENAKQIMVEHPTSVDDIIALLKNRKAKLSLQCATLEARLKS